MSALRLRLLPAAGLLLLLSVTPTTAMADPAAPDGSAADTTQPAELEPSSDPAAAAAREDGPRPGAPAARTGVKTEFLSDEGIDATGSYLDSFGLGETVTVPGDVADNAFLLGRTVTVSTNGAVTGDLFAAGETVDVVGTVLGDVYAAGSRLKVHEGAHVGGNFFGGGETITINGPVDGDVNGGGGRVYINAPVGGDVHVGAGKLELGESAAIAGSLTYSASEEAKMADGATVAGAVDFTEKLPEPESAKKAGGGLASALGWFIWSLLASFLLGSALIWLIGPTSRRPSDTLVAEPGPALGIGLGLAVLVPAGAVMAMVTVIGLPLGMFALLALGIGFFLARLVTSFALGDALLKRFTGRSEVSPYGALAFGLLVFYAVTAIPFLGGIAWLLAVLGGLGALGVTLQRSRGGSTPSAPAEVAAPTATPASGDPLTGAV